MYSSIKDVRVGVSGLVTIVSLKTVTKCHKVSQFILPHILCSYINGASLEDDYYGVQKSQISVTSLMDDP